MEYKKAFELAISSCESVSLFERVNIFDSLYRVLAKDLYVMRDLPPYNNSAMDGYAFKHKDINKGLKIVSTILAGNLQQPILKDGECYKIMTGAKIPNDCDTVVPKELTLVKNSSVKIIQNVKQGNAIRVKGEEIKKGETLLKKGERLNASKIALLASQGIREIKCYRELKIAIVNSGSELKELNQNASDDEIYNINGINILMHLKEFGINARYCGVLPDNLSKSIEFFESLKSYDIIITTGGVSVGEADFTKEALIQNGFVELFHGVKVKPGHPLLIGKIGKTVVIALPGNPLAAILHLILVGIPMILKKGGANRLYYKTIEAKIESDLKLKPNRVNIVLGNYENSIFLPYKSNKYGSGMITPLVESNSLAIFGERVGFVPKGSKIKIVDFKSMPNFLNMNYIV